jgi:hypothetical protein
MSKTDVKLYEDSLYVLKFAPYDITNILLVFGTILHVHMSDEDPEKLIVYIKDALKRHDITPLG